MHPKRSVALSPLLPGLVLLAACSSDPTSSGGEGTEKFTTWGEEYIEDGIPADPEGQSGFLDDWALRYDKFLVNFHSITVADTNGHVGARSRDSYFVDNTRPGRKELVSFTALEARAWEQVSYEIKPALAGAVVVSGDEEDLKMMTRAGYSIYVEGSATKGSTTKTFHWGFTTATAYRDCHHEEEGKDTLGVVVTNGSTDTSELTTHGDHFFYDRLQVSPDPAIPTSLRFDEKAAADDTPHGDGDGEITLDELSKLPIDVRKYNPSPFTAPNMGAFVTALARTIGHFRGEGECTIKGL
jgi:hypothetical protein